MDTRSGLIVFLVIFLSLSFHEADAAEQSRGGELEQPIIDNIVIGIEDYTLLAKHKETIKFVFPIARGTKKKPTPLGNFTIINRLKNPWYTPDDEDSIEPGEKNPLGTRWMGINKPQYGLHGTRNPNSIGTRASDGCIRLLNRDIEKLYKHVDKSTNVTIKKRLPDEYRSLKKVKRIATQFNKSK